MDNAQTKWLAANGIAYNGRDTFSPVGADVFSEAYYYVTKIGGDDAWILCHAYVDGKFGTADPCAKEVSKFATLKGALSAMVRRLNATCAA